MTGRWRVGTKVPRNLYRDDEPIAMLADEDTARSIAEKMNYAEWAWRRIEELERQLARRDGILDELRIEVEVMRRVWKAGNSGP